MQEQNNNGASVAAEADVYPLDDAAVEAITELDINERNITVARNAILSYFLRQHKLVGNWTLAENRRELVRRAVPAPAGD